MVNVRLVPESEKKAGGQELLHSRTGGAAERVKLSVVMMFLFRMVLRC